jgi:hypothetical protein
MTQFIMFGTRVGHDRHPLLKMPEYQATGTISSVLV